MSDYAELVKSLRYVAENHSTTSPEILTDAADAIEQLSNAGSAYGRGWTLGYDAGREESKPRWIPVTFEDGGLTASIPDEYDGCWIIVTDGRLISVERFKKDAYDHFYPNGRWFDLEDVTHWMPLHTPPKEETE